MENVRGNQQKESNAEVQLSDRDPSSGIEEANHFPDFVSTVRLSTIISSSTYKGRFAHTVHYPFRQIDPDVLHSLCK